MLSEDFGGPVGVRRGELIGEGVAGAPVADLLARIEVVARAAGVRFGGAIVVLPDDDLVQPVTELGGARHPGRAGRAQRAVDRAAPGRPRGASIGGNEIFDVRTRLQQAVRFV